MSATANTKLGKIKEQMTAIKDEANKGIEELKAKAAKLVLKGKEAAIKKLVSEVESSRELTSVANDEWLHQWKRVDFSKIIDPTDELQREILKEHLSNDHHVDCDFKNDCVSLSIGPVIMIYDDGVVYDQDSQKQILSKKDYESEAERNKLIEAHMEETGCFPAVVRYDYHGNAFYVNTKDKK